MNSRSEVSDIIYNGDKIEVTNELFDHLFIFFKKINLFSQKEIAAAIGYNEKSLSYLINNRPKDLVVTSPMKKFAYLAFKYISECQSLKSTFNKHNNTFVLNDTKQQSQFKPNSIYYGYFRKSDVPHEAKFHFVLKVDGNTITVWSKYGSLDYITSTGELEENNSTYFCVLKNEEGKTHFFIGKRTPDLDRKVFIGTWSTEKGEICSALCLVYLIEDSPFDSIEKVKEAKSTLLQDILSRNPDDAEEFFKWQEYKFITEKTIKSLWEQ